MSTNVYATAAANAVNLESLRLTETLRPTAILLVEWVGASSPVGEEQAETDGFEHASESTDGDGIERTFLCEDLGDELEHR